MNVLLKISLLIGIMTGTLFAADYSDKGKIYFASDGVSGNIDVKWRLWTLMGEPVDMLTARWNIQKINFDGTPDYYKYIAPGSNSWYYEICSGEENVHCIPAHIMERARIVDLSIYVYDKKTLNKYLFDAGVMSKPYGGYFKYGSWGYNTPGSPSWDKAFIEHRSVNDSYYDEVDAKKIMEQGFTGVAGGYDYKIRDIKLDVSGIKRYILDRTKKYYSDKVGNRHDNLVRKSSDPFEILEKMDEEKEDDGNLQNYEQLEEKYAVYNKELDTEVVKKEKIYKLTKERVAGREAPIQDGVPKSYVITSSQLIKRNQIGGMKIERYDQEQNALIVLSQSKGYLITKSGKIINLDDLHVSSFVSSGQKRLFLAQSDDGSFYIYPHPYIRNPSLTHFDENGNKIHQFLLKDIDENMITRGYRYRYFQMREGKDDTLIGLWSESGIYDKEYVFFVISKNGKLIKKVNLKKTESSKVYFKEWGLNNYDKIASIRDRSSRDSFKYLIYRDYENEGKDTLLDIDSTNTKELACPGSNKESHSVFSKISMSNKHITMYHQCSDDSEYAFILHFLEPRY